MGALRPTDGRRRGRSSAGPLSATGARTAAAPAAIDRASLLRLLLLAAIWGMSFLFIKVSLEGLAPTQLVLARIALGMTALLSIVAVRGDSLPREPAVWGHLAVLGLLANLLPFSGFAWGEQHIASGLAGIYNASTPLFTLLVAMAALPEERPSRARTGGLVLGFLGVLVVLAPWRGVGSGALAGQLACLAAAACYGVAITYTRKYLSPRGYSPLVLAAGQLLCATAMLAVLVPLWATGPVRLHPRVVLSILALGAFGTGIAYLLFYRLIAEIGATAASTVTYLAPLVAVVVGVVLLGESVGWNDFVGAAVVLLGVAVAGGQLRRTGTGRAAG